MSLHSLSLSRRSVSHSSVDVRVFPERWALYTENIFSCFVEHEVEAAHYFFSPLWNAESPGSQPPENTETALYNIWQLFAIKKK